jgi:hypothetical protein
MSSTARKLFDIFRGNPRAHGRSVPKDGDPRAGGMKVEEPYTVDVVRQHLDGKQEAGVYPSWHNQDGELVCQLGICDIDTREGAWEETYTLATALRAMGMVPHVEKSRSKGFHIWVFPDQEITAKSMRRALKVAYAAIELPAKEANPKSEQLKPGQLGNYIRLPYFNRTHPDGNQMFHVGWDRRQPGLPIPPSDWLYEFDGSCTTSSAIIQDWASRWKEPDRKVIVDLRAVNDDELASLIHRLPGDLRLFVEKGPQADRSSGLVALAYKLRASKYSAKEIYSIIRVADMIWGNKYSARPDGDKYLVDIVERCVQ